MGRQCHDGQCCNDPVLQKKALQELVQIVQIVFQVSKQWCLGPLLCLKLTGSTFCSAAKKTAKRVKCDILARSWSEWWRDKESARKEEGDAQGRHQLSHSLPFLHIWFFTLFGFIFVQIYCSEEGAKVVGFGCMDGPESRWSRWIAMARPET